MGILRHLCFQRLFVHGSAFLSQGTVTFFNRGRGLSGNPWHMPQRPGKATHNLSMESETPDGKPAALPHNSFVQ